jgi:hypothetical protein
MYWSEKYQLGPLLYYLRQNNVEYATEANLYSVPIDVVCKRDNVTMAIELKTRDFARGIKQAERNASVVDFSYLSVYEENITEDLVNRVDCRDIGLFSVGDRVECLSPPTKNNPSRHAKESVIEYISANVRE